MPCSHHSAVSLGKIGVEAGVAGHERLDELVSSGTQVSVAMHSFVEGEAEIPCNADWIADGYCDEQNNNEKCGWDGGDCCPCTCHDVNPLFPLCGATSYYYDDEDLQGGFPDCKQVIMTKQKHLSLLTNTLTNRS